MWHVALEVGGGGYLPPSNASLGRGGVNRAPQNWGTGSGKGLNGQDHESVVINSGTEIIFFSIENRQFFFTEYMANDDSGALSAQPPEAKEGRVRGVKQGEGRHKAVRGRWAPPAADSNTTRRHANRPPPPPNILRLHIVLDSGKAYGLRTGIPRPAQGAVTWSTS